jgi:hypothetical protein
VNAERERRGLPPLDIVLIPRVLGEDHLAIASRRIRSGQIDAEGRRRAPLRVGLVLRAELRRPVEGAIAATWPRTGRSLALRRPPPGSARASSPAGLAKRAALARGTGDWGIAAELVRPAGASPRLTMAVEAADGRSALGSEPVRAGPVALEAAARKLLGRLVLAP